MCGFVLKAVKSSSFIDSNMLASIPRDVPIPCKQRFEVRLPAGDVATERTML